MACTATKQCSTRSATCWHGLRLGRKIPKKPPCTTTLCPRRTTQDTLRCNSEGRACRRILVYYRLQQGWLHEKNDRNVYSFNNVTGQEKRGMGASRSISAVAPATSTICRSLPAGTICADVSAEAGNCKRRMELSQGTADKVMGEVHEAWK